LPFFVFATVKMLPHMTRPAKPGALLNLSSIDKAHRDGNLPKVELTYVQVATTIHSDARSRGSFVVGVVHDRHRRTLPASMPDDLLPHRPSPRRNQLSSIGAQMLPSRRSNLPFASIDFALLARRIID
jgi:hypothetical protein